MKRCFQVNAEDNVATLLEDAGPEGVAVLGSAPNATIELLEPIKLGHKVCTRAAAEGDLIVKYGVPIGVAIKAIPTGAWVHLHNCASRVDERSNHLDVLTGVAKDTAYV
jgi:tetrahydromethanopterin S-methyltransferase subunit H